MPQCLSLLFVNASTSNRALLILLLPNNKKDRKDLNFIAKHCHGDEVPECVCVCVRVLGGGGQNTSISMDQDERLVPEGLRGSGV